MDSSSYGSKMYVSESSIGSNEVSSDFFGEGTGSNKSSLSMKPPEIAVEVRDLDELSSSGKTANRKMDKSLNFEDFEPGHCASTRGNDVGAYFSTPMLKSKITRIEFDLNESNIPFEEENSVTSVAESIEPSIIESSTDDSYNSKNFDVASSAKKHMSLLLKHVSLNATSKPIKNTEPEKLITDVPIQLTPSIEKAKKYVSKCPESKHSPLVSTNKNSLSEEESRSPGIKRRYNLRRKGKENSIPSDSDATQKFSGIIKTVFKDLTNKKGVGTKGSNSNYSTPHSFIKKKNYPKSKSMLSPINFNDDNLSKLMDSVMSLRLSSDEKEDNKGKSTRKKKGTEPEVDIYGSSLKAPSGKELITPRRKLFYQNNFDDPLDSEKYTSQMDTSSLATPSTKPKRLNGFSAFLADIESPEIPQENKQPRNTSEFETTKDLAPCIAKGRKNKGKKMFNSIKEEDVSDSSEQSQNEVIEIQEKPLELGMDSVTEVLADISMDRRKKYTNGQVNSTGSSSINGIEESTDESHQIIDDPAAVDSSVEGSRNESKEKSVHSPHKSSLDTTDESFVIVKQKKRTAVLSESSDDNSLHYGADAGCQNLSDEPVNPPNEIYCEEKSIGPGTPEKGMFVSIDELFENQTGIDEGKTSVHETSNQSRKRDTLHDSLTCKIAEESTCRVGLCGNEFMNDEPAQENQTRSVENSLETNECHSRMEVSEESPPKHNDTVEENLAETTKSGEHFVSFVRYSNKIKEEYLPTNTTSPLSPVCNKDVIVLSDSDDSFNNFIRSKTPKKRNVLNDSSEPLKLVVPELPIDGSWKGSDGSWKGSGVGSKGKKTDKIYSPDVLILGGNDSDSDDEPSDVVYEVRSGSEVESIDSSDSDLEEAPRFDLASYLKKNIPANSVPLDSSFSQRKKRTLADVDLPQPTGDPHHTSFLLSLSGDVPEEMCHPAALKYRTSFQTHKEHLIDILFKMYNLEVFNGKMPPVDIKWSGRLTTTSGITKSAIVTTKNGKMRTSGIKLSKTVVDNASKLRDVLLHELCHAANWLIDMQKGGHGPLFKKWADNASHRFPEIPRVNTYHGYELKWKYTYKCTHCSYEFGKMKLNLKEDSCRICGGRVTVL